MSGDRTRPLRTAALHLAVAAALSLVLPATPRAATIAAGLTVRAEGRAPIRDGRIDAAYQQALDESFRRGLLDALRGIAPERQTPRDLETWQETVLSRAGEFVGAWRVLAQEQRDGFMTLEVEIEVWREKLARAALAPGAAAAAPAVRLVVLAEPLPLADRSAGEELDAAGIAAAALEAELSRRGAVIVATTDRAPWERAAGAATEENRVALATAAARRLDADAVLIAQLTRRGEHLALSVQLIALASETTLTAARADVPLLRDRPLAESFAPAARQLAAACAPHFAAARSARRRGTAP